MSKDVTLIHELCKYIEDEDLDGVTAILDNNDIDLNVESGYKMSTTPLTLAVGSKNIDIVEILLKNHADPNYIYEGPSGSETSAFLNVVLDHDIRMVRLMLKYKADPILMYKDNMSRYFGRNGEDMKSPLWYAISHKQYDIIKDMLDAGANPNSVCADFGNDNLQHPLHMTFDKNIIRLLLEHDADVNIKSMYYKNTALHEYCDSLIRTIDFEVLNMFLEAGADLTIRNNYGETILENLHKRDRIKIMDHIQNYGMYRNVKRSK